MDDNFQNNQEVVNEIPPTPPAADKKPMLSMILGIVSIVCGIIDGCCCGIFALIGIGTGIAAIVLSKKCTATDEKSLKQLKIGFIAGIAGIAVTIIVFAISTLLGSLIVLSDLF